MTLISDLSKAELLAGFYKTIIGTKLHIPNEGRLQTCIDCCLKEPSDDPINSNFTLHELQSQIHSLKPKKTCGHDMVANKLLCNLPESFQIKLLSPFSNCWELGYDPKEWKLQQIVPALKPGKDPSLPSSYRPISLISCLGKLLEKMVNTRLTW